MVQTSRFAYIKQNFTPNANTFRKCENSSAENILNQSFTNLQKLLYFSNSDQITGCARLLKSHTHLYFFHFLDHPQPATPTCKWKYAGDCSLAMPISLPHAHKRMFCIVWCHMTFAMGRPLQFAREFANFKRHCDPHRPEADANRSHFRVGCWRFGVGCCQILRPS